MNMSPQMPTENTEPSAAWTILALDTAKEFAGHSSVVLSAQWRCAYGLGKHQMFMEGKCFFPLPKEGDEIVPFEELTQTKVLGWIKSEMWTETVEEILKVRYDTMMPTFPETPQNVDMMMMRPILWGN